MLDFGKKKENDEQSSKLTNLDNIKKQSTPYKRNRKVKINKSLYAHYYFFFFLMF